MSQPLHPPISVLIITHRRDKRFAACLASVEWADEVKIVEVDQPIIDFSQLKNQHLVQLAHDWVLLLDSDEIISPELVKLIPELLQQPNFAAAAIKRIDYFRGQEMKWGEVRSVYPIRLARKDKIRFVRPVHEVAEVDGRVIKLDTPIYHFPHNSVTEFWQKISQYATLEANYRHQQGRTTGWLELSCYPLAKFVYNYCFRLGLLDGMRGLVYAVMMSCHSLIVRAKLYELSTMGSPRT
jgi:glycosyltransferase involved in cell wall biosynthesis